MSSYAGGNYIAYNLKVENPSNIKLNLKIYNDYFSKEEVITTGDINGVIEGLEPLTEYKLDVYGSQGFGKKTFFTKKFKTLKESEKFETKINVDFTNKLGSDTLYYKVKIKDFFNYYSNYQVFITDASVTKELQLKGDIQDEQSINIKIVSKEFSFFITADSKAPNDIANNKTNVVLYKANIANS